MHALLEQSHAPLLLAGDQKLTSLFRHTCKYDGLLGETINGNPDHLSAKVLYHSALSIVQNKLRADRQQLVEPFNHLQQHGRGTTKLEEIFPALQTHRIDTLFMAEGQQVWGLFSKTSEAIEIHPSRRDDDEDLLNLLAKQAIAKKIDWVVLPPEKMPDQSPVAAILKY